MMVNVLKGPINIENVETESRQVHLDSIKNRLCSCLQFYTTNYNIVPIIYVGTIEAVYAAAMGLLGGDKPFYIGLVTGSMVGEKLYRDVVSKGAAMLEKEMAALGPPVLGSS